MEDPTTSPVSWDVLPTEILDNILSSPSLSTDDYYAVATLSRRLNSLSIPRYLERGGILNPSSIVIDLSKRHKESDSSSVLLRGLAIYLDHKHFTLLQCICYNPLQYDIQKQATCPKKVQTLTRIIARTESVDQFHISMCPPSKVIDLDTQMENWRLGLYDLLDTVVQRKCQRLFLFQERRELGSKQIARETSKLPPWIRKPIKRTKRFIDNRRYKGNETALTYGREWLEARPKDPRAIKKNKIPTTSTPRSSVGARAENLWGYSLERLNLLAGQFLLPPYFDWMISFIRQTQGIEQLLFGDYRFLVKIWPHVLPHLGEVLRTTLTHLTIAEYQARSAKPNGLTAPDIFAFLSMLDSLKFLTIDFSFGDLEYAFAELPRDGLPVPLLPSLIRLEAPSHFVARLLQAPLFEEEPELPPGLPPILPLVEYVSMLSPIEPGGWAMEEAASISLAWSAWFAKVLDFKRQTTPKFTFNFRNAEFQMNEVRHNLETFLTQVDEMDPEAIPQLKRVYGIHFPQLIDATMRDVKLLLRFTTSQYPDVKEIGIPIWPFVTTLGLDPGVVPDDIKEFMEDFRRTCPGVPELIIGNCRLGFSEAGVPQINGQAEEWAEM